MRSEMLRETVGRAHLDLYQMPGKMLAKMEVAEQIKLSGLMAIVGSVQSIRGKKEHAV
jgi:hypothetical protein